MAIKKIYTSGQKVPFHSHPQEQYGYVISGKHILQYDDVKEKLNLGDSYCIPENIEHAWEIFNGGEAIDVFNPPRTDY